jgi:hypothetical protein
MTEYVRKFQQNYSLMSELSSSAGPGPDNRNSKTDNFEDAEEEGARSIRSSRSSFIYSRALCMSHL